MAMKHTTQETVEVLGWATCIVILIVTALICILLNTSLAAKFIR
jgi:hypothetical protein